ncbi:aBC transporter permease protein [Firmicutes bacterium CAG:341]|nr:aBC transporter permease protein [Firmicutes bacterium CAG:341]
MNIANKLTYRHLKENKGRTVVTTLGICVSVAMITAVFVAMASFLNLFGEIGKISSGNWDAYYYHLSQSQIEQVEKDSRISKVGLKYGSENKSFQIKNPTSYKRGTAEMIIGDKSYFEMVLTGNFDGKVPANENEVAVEKDFLDKNGMKDAKVGDKIVLTQGQRQLDDGSYVTGSNFNKDEKFVPSGDEKEYTITAILHTNPATKYSSVWRGISEDEIKSDDICAYITLAKQNSSAYSTIEDIQNDYKIDVYQANEDVLASYLSGRQGGFLATMLPIVLVVLILIVIASVMLIYNAFGMSLSERVRYLGMLASVGATKSQKRKSVYFEGAILGAIGIPVGILAGILGISITLKLVGHKIISTGMIAGVNDSNMQMKTVVPAWAIIGIILVSIFTIFISAFIPARKASKITPIDAIRQRQEIKVKPKKLKAPKYIKKIFGYEGELAYKNLKRNGKKSRLITVSIALSIVLFISCNYFCSMFIQASGYEKNIPYQISTTITYGHKKELYDALDKMQGVNKYYIDATDMSISLGKSSPFIKNNEIKDLANYTSDYSKLFGGEKYVSTVIHYVDDSEFNTLCENNGIDYNIFYGDSLKCVLLNNLTHKQDTTKVFNDSIIGKHIIQNPDYASDDRNPLDIEVGGLVKFDKNSLPCNLVAPGVVGIIMPYSQYINVVNKGVKANDISMNVCVETDEHKEVAENLTTLLNENDFGSNYVSDNIDALETMNTVIFIIQVFVYGFITLISLITIANIINTISANIALRRKEFAMLKSVGTTPKGFSKMVSLESVFYALKAVIFGVPISVLISVVLNKMLGESSIPYHFDIKLYLSVIIVVFVLILITMIYSVRKLKSDNIIEALKEDIS